MHFAFFPVELFDGFDTTANNVKGFIASFIPNFIEEEGSHDVVEVTKMPTPGGSLSLYRGTKAE